MAESERLRILFDGKDEALLSMDVGLKPPVESPQPAPSARPAAPVVTAPPTMESKKQPTAQSAAVAESDSDNYSDDEYLAALSLTAKESKKRAKKTAKKPASNARRMPGGKMENVPVQTSGIDSAPSQNGVSKLHYYCPIVAISRFPYKYIKGGVADHIAKSFFDSGKFFVRPWDIYYVYPPPSVSAKPIFLIPRRQVQQLLNEVNEAFACDISIPPSLDTGVLLPFEDDGTPQPRFLGTSTSREMKETLEARVPSRSGHYEAPAGSSLAVDRSFAAFKAKMEAALEATRRKSKAAKGKRQRDQTQKLQHWCRSLRRTQCYLGLRPRLSRDTEQPKNSSDLSWDEQKKSDKEYALATGTTLEPLDIDESAPFAFADEPIFICVDIEANERAHQQITEIGVSTLDTLDLVGISPGKGGCNWMNKIRTRHFRVKEYANVVNSEFLVGCPENFEFGTSEWISIQEAVKVLEGCFSPPYSGHADYCTRREADHANSNKNADGARPTKEEPEDASDGGVKLATGSEKVTLWMQTDGTNDTEYDAQAPVAGGSYKSQEGHIPAYKKTQRNIILLGHNLSADVNYMQKMGCTIFETLYDAKKSRKKGPDEPRILEAIDTNVLFRVLKRETQPSSLSKVLLDLGLTGWHLHNAGNDARYTMEAMVGIALKSRLEKADCLTPPGGSTTNNPNPGTNATTSSTKKSAQTATLTPSPDEESDSEDDPQERAWKKEVERRVATQVKDTENRVRDECGMWDAALGPRGDWDIATDDVDGGLPGEDGGFSSA